jgi:hypothetical protein
LETIKNIFFCIINSKEKNQSKLDEKVIILCTFRKFKIVNGPSKNRKYEELLPPPPKFGLCMAELYPSETIVILFYNLKSIVIHEFFNKIPS